MKRLAPSLPGAWSAGILLALSSAPLAAQSTSPWRFAIGAGTVSESRAPAHFTSSLGAAASLQATYRFASRLGLRAEGSWSAVPARAFRSPPALNYPGLAVAPCPSSGCSFIPPRPARGHLGIAGASGAIVIPFSTRSSVGEYVLVGGGAYRDYTVPRTDDGWSTTSVLTTGAVELGYGMRFGARERFGIELRAHRFAAGSVRWLFPVALTVAF